MTVIDTDQVLIEYEQYEKGRKLRSLVGQPGWETVLQVLRDYRDKAKDDLIDLQPGDPTVPTAHAAASAVSQVVNYFEQDINNAIEIASHPSPELVEFITQTRDNLDVLKHQGVQYG
jgi:hypothetical protein